MDKFIINFDKPNFGFNALNSGYFVNEILKKRTDLKSKQLFSRLIRTGIIGHILFEKGEEFVTKEKITDKEFIAALFESYLFLVRTIYDYLLYFLKKQHRIEDNSFKKFINKLKRGDYPDIDKKLRKHILSSKFFDEIRDLRDSIKQKTPYIFIYVKNNKYRVRGTIYKRNGGKKGFDEELCLKVFGYSAALVILMAYIAKDISGFSLEEQLSFDRRLSRHSDRSTK